jgi:hypothetical protein
LGDHLAVSQQSSITAQACFEPHITRVVPPDGIGRFMGDFYRSFVGEQNQTASSRAASTPPWCSSSIEQQDFFTTNIPKIDLINANADESIIFSL